MKRQWQQLVEQLGWQGIAGVALLCLAAGFAALALEPLERETGALRNRLEGGRSKLVLEEKTFGLGDRQSELGQFYDSLPSEEDVTDILAGVYAIAEASGVGLKQAEYHLETKDSPRVEYRISFPAQGEYGQLRFFVLRVLAEYPAISLDQVDFRRDKISDPVLRAEVRLTLFLRPQDSSDRVSRNR